MADRRILIIDQDPSFADLLMRFLGPYGIEVDMIENGDDGLQKAKDSNPELLFIAVDLPDKAGYAICNKAKRGAVKNIPVILATASVSPADLEQHKKLRYRADEYLDKRTLTQDELLGKVDQLIGLGGASTEDGDIGELDDAEEIALDSEDLAVDVDPEDTGVQDSPTQRPPPALLDGVLDSETEAAFDALKVNDGRKEGSFDEPDDGVTLMNPGSKPRQLPKKPPATPKSAAPVSSTPAGDTKRQNKIDAEDPSTDQADLADLALGLDDVAKRAAEERSGLNPLGPHPRIAELEGEVVRLRREVEEAKKAGSSGSSPFSREREFLNLREVINRKEKEILELKEENDARDREVSGLKEKLRDQEKRQRETEERLHAVDGQLGQATESIAALNQEKEKGGEREKGLKARLEMAQSEIRKGHEELDAVKRRAAAENEIATKELDRERSEHERSRREAASRLAQLESDQIAARKQAEDERLSQLSAMEKQLEDEHLSAMGVLAKEKDDEIERMRREHAQTLDRMREDHGREVQALQTGNEESLARKERQFKDALQRAQEEREAMLNAAEESRQADLADAEARRQMDVTAAEERRVRELAVQKADNDQIVKDLEATHADEMRRAEEASTKALEEAEQRRVQELADAESRRVRELDAAEGRRARELDEAEQRRQRELADADQRRQNELAAAEEKRQGDLRAAEESFQSDLADERKRHAEEKSGLESAHADQVAQLRGEISRLEKSLEEANGRIRDLEAEVQKHLAQIATHERRIENLEKDVSDRDADIRRLKENIEELEKQNAGYQDQVLKAYQKMKADEQTVEKAKKAMAIALTLLDNGQNNPPPAAPT
jgi:CheY-like chemotaxis protein